MLQITFEADEDMQSILQNFVSQMPKRGVIHRFTSGQALAEYCLSEGFHFGFNGISTFNNAANVRDIIALTPVEKILFETDSPYLTPITYRGCKNEPKYLPFICRKSSRGERHPFNIFHTIIGAFSIKTDVYKKEFKEFDVLYRK